MPEPQQAPQGQVSDDVMTKFMALPPDKRRAALGRMSDSTKQTLLTQLKARPQKPTAKAKGTPTPTPQGGVTPLTAPGGKGTGWLTDPGGLGRKLEVGAMRGATEPLGIQIPDPNKPSSLTWGSIASQMISGLGHQAAQSLAQFGPLAPIDMVAKGMEGLAEGVITGAKRTAKGVATGDPEEIARGVIGGGSSIGMGMEGIEGASKIANKIKSFPNVPLNTIWSMTKAQDLFDRYVHAAGLDLKDTYTAATKNVGKWIEHHASALNRAIPQDAIDSADVLAKANTAVNNLVKTPHGQIPEIKAITDSIRAHPPGRWSFEAAKQFRSDIFAAMRRTSGPMNKAFTQIYDDITAKMKSAAHNVVGGDDSFERYHNLTRNFYENFADHVQDILESDTGAKVTGALLKDAQMSKEAIKSLARYGLDSKKVTQFMKQAQRIVDAKKFLGNSIFKYVSRDKFGWAAYAGGHLAGLGWIGSMVPAVATGLTHFYLKNLRTIMDLDPSIIENVEERRALETPKPTTIVPPTAGATPQAGATPPTATPGGTPPVGGTPPTAGAQQAPATAPQAAAVPQKIQPLTAAEKLNLRKKVAASSAAGTAAGPGAQASTTGTPSAPSPSATTSVEPKTAMQVEREELLAKAGKEIVSNLAEIKKIEAEAKKPPEVQKIPEGVHGDPQEALREKWRERKAATRQQSVRTEVKGAEEKAIGGGPASAKEFDDLPSVDIEKDLSGDSPEGKTLVTALKKLKAKEGWDDDVYRGHLVEMAKGYAKRMAKRKK